MQWRIGDVTVTKMVELEVTGGSRFILPQATREAIQPIAWLRPHFADDDGRLRMSIHSFVVQTPTRRIVVDTCLGNDKQGRRIPTLERSAGAVSGRPGGGGVSARVRSIRCCARISTWIMSAGTPCWWTANGCRRFLGRAT